MKRRIDAGETFDVVITSPELVDEWVRQGKFAADTRAMLARTGLGMGVPKGATKPDISSVDAFKRTLLNAKTVGYPPEAQPGIHFMEILDRLGIGQDVRPKLKAYSPDELPKAVERHEVEIVAATTGLAFSRRTLSISPPRPTSYSCRM